jgi:hypothetical protein
MVFFIAAIKFSILIFFLLVKMSSNKEKLWRVVNVNNEYENILCDEEPQKTSDDVDIDKDKTIIIADNDNPVNIKTNDSMNIVSNLSNSQAINIIAPNGGMNICSGLGGINQVSPGNINVVSSKNNLLFDAKNINIGIEPGTKLINIGNKSNIINLNSIITKIQSMPIKIQHFMLSAEQLLSGILYIIPDKVCRLFLPDVNDILKYVTSVGSSFDFTIINMSKKGTNNVILNPSASGTILGNSVIYPANNIQLTYSNYTSGSGMFKLIVTNISPKERSYIVVRIS